MAIDINDFNYISSQDVDQIIFYREGTESFTGVANSPYYSTTGRILNISTDVNELLYPTLLLSTDGTNWFESTGGPYVYVTSTIANGYGQLARGGVDSSAGNMDVHLSVLRYWTGTLHYRLWGTSL